MDIIRYLYKDDNIKICVKVDNVLESVEDSYKITLDLSRTGVNIIKIK